MKALKIFEFQRENNPHHKLNVGIPTSIRPAQKWEATSFHHTVIHTTPQKLIKLAERIGAEYYDQNTGDDKTNFDFEFDTKDGTYFTVYDWKEYRELGYDEIVEFHIGTDDPADSIKALAALEEALDYIA